MNTAAIVHISAYPYVYLAESNRLVVKLQCARKDIRSCVIHYFARTAPETVRSKALRVLYRDAEHDYFMAELLFHRRARYQKYYFELADEEETLYLSAYGISAGVPDNGYFEFLYSNDADIISTPAWSRGQIFYQIFPERYCNGNRRNDPPDTVPWGTAPTRDNYMGGDLQGIIDRLDYLSGLGVECLYLNPIFTADFNHKYATTDYFSVDPQFGTGRELKELVERAHSRGIRIVLDGVFNHTGIHFPPFQDVLLHQEESRYRHWYLIDRSPATVSHQDYECVGAYKYMPKLNTSNAEVREFVWKVIEYWIREYNIDGWRLDVADEVADSLWTMIRTRLKAEYPEALLLGETWGPGYRLMNGMEMDSVMNYVFRDAVRDYIALGVIGADGFEARMGRMLSDYPRVMNQSMFNLLDSHDTERFRFLCGEDRAKFVLGLVVLMMFEGSPSVYYGDEIGMTGANDPDCRRCMKWDEAGQDRELLVLYRQLLEIRKTYSCVRTGQTAFVYSSERLVAFTRFDEETEVVTVINAGNTEEIIAVPVMKGGRYRGLYNASKRCELSSEVPGDAHNSDMWKYQAVLKLSVRPGEAQIISTDRR